MLPRFAVITPAFNSAATIARTIDSVLAQSLRDFEYLVVDGGSTDATCDIVLRYTDPRLRLISEPDRGTYDAMNKGIANTRGELVAILNSDDVYADEHVLIEVAHSFAAQELDVVYGDLAYVNAAGKVVRRWKSGPYDPQGWHRGWHPPHPATFISRAAYESLSPSPRNSGERAGVRGYYDPSLKLAADYKLLLSLGVKAQAAFGYLPRTLVRMATGGASTQGLGAVIRGNKEVLRAWKDLGLKAPLSLVPRKLAYKLKGKLAR